MRGLLHGAPLFCTSAGAQPSCQEILTSENPQTRVPCGRSVLPEELPPDIASDLILHRNMFLINSGQAWDTRQPFWGCSMLMRTQIFQSPFVKESSLNHMGILVRALVTLVRTSHGDSSYDLRSMPGLICLGRSGKTFGWLHRGLHRACFG